MQGVCFRNQQRRHWRGTAVPSPVASPRVRQCETSGPTDLFKVLVAQHFVKTNLKLLVRFLTTAKETHSALSKSVEVLAEWILTAYRWRHSHCAGSTGDWRSPASCVKQEKEECRHPEDTQIFINMRQVLLLQRSDLGALCTAHIYSVLPRLCTDKHLERAGCR